MGISVPVRGLRRVRRRMPAGPHPAPLSVIVPAAAGLLFVTLPMAGLLARSVWPVLTSDPLLPGMGAALRTSLVTSSIAALACVATGVPLAWMLARAEFRGRPIVRGLVLAPLVLPPAAGGVALLTVLGREGVLGRWPYAVLGVTLPPSAAVVIAQAFVALPFLVLCAEGTFRAADPRLTETALALGATRGAALRRITLPLAVPGLAAGAALCWARAMGEATAVATVTGGLIAGPAAGGAPPPGADLVAGTPEAVFVLGPVLLGLTAGVLWCLRGRWVSPA
jgi:molybdate transport system permease protein